MRKDRVLDGCEESVVKVDRTDDFILPTPTGATKTRCVRRLEGDSAWDLLFLTLCVGSRWNATTKSTQEGPTIQPKDELASGRREKRLYPRQSILQAVLELDHTQMSADGVALKMETRQEQEANARELYSVGRKDKNLVLQFLTQAGRRA